MGNMSKDLRTFMEYVERVSPENLVRVSREVSPKHEMSALVNNLGGGLPSLGRYKSPALLFENVRGYNMPVITNLFATRKLISLGLEVGERDLMHRYLQAEENPIEPTTVQSGPVKEVVQKGDEIDMNKMPIVTHCDQDIGAFITPGVLLVRDPESGRINAGIYRHMLQGKTKLGTSFAPQSHGAHIMREKEAKGEDLECALVVGHHPAFHAASQYCGQFKISELAVAGGLLGESLEMVKCETVDLEVPAYAEIVIEGKVKGGQREDDAPFGEYLAYYGDEVIKRHVMEVTAVTMRKDAIFHDLHNGGTEHLLLSMATGFETELYRRVHQCVPQVTQSGEGPTATDLLR